MSAIIPNGLEYFLLGDWEPCTKKKLSEVAAKVRLSRINDKRKHKHFKRRRKEVASYYCKECMAWHLTSRKQ